MIDSLSFWISLLFAIVYCVFLRLFYLANGKHKGLISAIIIWSIIQSIMSFYGIYQTTNSTLPRILWAIFPPFFVVVYGLLGNPLKWVLVNRDIKFSTLMHLVRFPIEIVLYQLYLVKMVPQLMTFDGRNYDIIIGISAPIMFLLYVKNKLSRKSLIIWNGLGLCFVCFIMINALFSAESPIQQFAFNQPNKGVTFFPFVLLPAVIVPLVIWTHLTDLIKLIHKE